MLSRVGMVTGILIVFLIVAACECSPMEKSRPRNVTLHDRGSDAQEMSAEIAELIEEIVAVKDRMKETIPQGWDKETRRELGLPTDEEMDEMARKAILEVYVASARERFEMQERLSKILKVLTTHRRPSDGSR